jgi:hypothetical protein
MVNTKISKLNFSVKVLVIFLLILFLIYIKMHFNIIYCADEVNDNTVVNPILDTPIRIETTPRKVGKLLTSLGLSGASLYAGYYGLKSASLVNTVYPGTLGTKVVIGFALFTTGSLFGLGVHAINRRVGPSGPFIDVRIGAQGDRTTDVSSGHVDSANCPLETSEFMFNPFANIDPFSDNPDLALLSVGILMVILGIQCFNLILIRNIFIKYLPRILSYFKFYPFIHNLLDKLILILNKTYKLYFICFSILGYLNLVGGTIFLLFLLNYLAHSS